MTDNNKEVGFKVFEILHFLASLPLASSDFPAYSDTSHSDKPVRVTLAYNDTFL